MWIYTDKNEHVFWNFPIYISNIRKNGIYEKLLGAKTFFTAFLIITS